QVAHRVSAIKQAMLSSMPKELKALEGRPRTRIENQCYEELIRLRRSLESDDYVIPTICDGVGPDYRFSEQSSEFRRFTKMRCAPQTTKDGKIHALMYTLLKAEGLDANEVKLI